MPTGKKDYVTMGDKAIYGIAGAGGGMMLHRFIGTFRKDIEKTLKRKLRGPEGYKIGTVTTFLSLVFPEDEVKYFVAGLGAGITVDDVIQRTFKKYDAQKVELGDLPDWEYMRKYSSLLHIDPLLPLRQKEQIILPYFPSVIYEQRPNPLQTAAIQRIIKETGINKDHLGLADCYWLQQWLLHYGIYEGNEGLWPGHDRIRTLAKLMRVRDTGKWQKDGHNAHLYDCDDAATVINQVMDYCGHNIYFLLISQKPDKADGVNPLHHILAVVKSGNRLWAVEGIKPLPIVPIEYLHRIFKNLKRAVIVNSDGTYYETTEWKKNKIKDDIKKKGAMK